jgi:signal transduction histidine kinase
MTSVNNMAASVDPLARGPEARVAEQSAPAAQRLLGELTGGIAHDFRNILTVIDSCLRLAENNISDPHKVCAFIAGAREAVDRGLRLTLELLTLARQKELIASAADVNELLAKLELFLTCAVGSSIRIDFQFSANLPKCPIDPPQFAAAILNLVINARDAMPNGGVIQVTTDSRDPEEGGSMGAYVRVRVKDNGLGMTKDIMKNIFEPFFTTKGKNGTGLGVPQVCAFIRQIGGRLNLDSEVGRGTTFDLFLPAVGARKSVPQLEVRDGVGFLTQAKATPGDMEGRKLDASFDAAPLGSTRPLIERPPARDDCSIAPPAPYDGLLFIPCERPASDGPVVAHPPKLERR